MPCILISAHTYVTTYKSSVNKSSDCKFIDGSSSVQIFRPKLPHNLRLGVRNSFPDVAFQVDRSVYIVILVAPSAVQCRMTFSEFSGWGFLAILKKWIPSKHHISGPAAPLRNTAFWEVTVCRLVDHRRRSVLYKTSGYFSTRKMEAACPFETSVTIYVTSQMSVIFMITAGRNSAFP